MAAIPPRPTKTFDFSQAVPAGVSVMRTGMATRMSRNGLVRPCPPDTQRIDHGADTRKPAS
jgi:hypothetical protein